MSDRETTSFRTSGGHDVVLNSYITGREARTIKNIYLSRLEFQQTQQGQSFGGVSGDATIEAENKALEIVVVSIDGSSDKIIDRVLELPSDEADEIIEKVNEITSGKKNLTKEISNYMNDRLVGDMLIVEVCQLFGWSYYEYLAQPVWFIELIHEKLRIDGEKSKRKKRFNQ